MKKVVLTFGLIAGLIVTALMLASMPLMGDGTIIHASGMVRIDTIDHYGIFRKDIRKYSHQLRIIKRIL